MFYKYTLVSNFLNFEFVLMISHRYNFETEKGRNKFLITKRKQGNKQLHIYKCVQVIFN